MLEIIYFVHLLQVRYEEDETIKNKIYIVKLNPQRTLGGLTDKCFEGYFQKEILVCHSVSLSGYCKQNHMSIWVICKQILFESIELKTRNYNIKILF